VAAGPALWNADMRWAEVDGAALRRALTDVVERVGPDPRGAAARAQLLARFGLEAATAIATERLASLRRHVQPPRGRVTPPQEATAPRVGLWHGPTQTHDVIVGRQVVVDDFVRHLGRHGHQHRYGLFCPEESAAPLANALGAPTANLDVHTRSTATGSVDLVAWHDPQFDPALAHALRSQRGGRYPITTTHHSLSYTSLLRSQLLPLLLHRPRPYDAIVCTTAPARRVVARLLGHVAETMKATHDIDVAYRGQLVTIPLGVDTERFRPRDRHVARRRMGIPSNAEVLLWVGRLSAIDKADLFPLVDAMVELHQRRPRIKLLCAGRQRPGESFGDLLASYAERRGIADVVEVRTAVGEELPMIYAAADLFVAPVDNIQESFGLAPVEAMACGIPQIVADWDGYRETVVDGQTGVLVPTLWTDAQADVELGSLVSDPAYDHLALSQSVAVDMVAFVQAVTALLEAPGRRTAMAEASRMRAEMLFGWPSVIAAHEVLWSQLAELASKAEADTTDLSELHRFPYAKAFRHYPTTWLAKDTPLTVTPRGVEVMKRGEGLPLPMLTRFPYLEVSLIQRIMVGLAKMAEKQQTLTLERIFAVVGKGLVDTPENRSRLNRHVMWLIKYGYCRRA